MQLFSNLAPDYKTTLRKKLDSSNLEYILNESEIDYLILENMNDL